MTGEKKIVDYFLYIGVIVGTFVLPFCLPIFILCEIYEQISRTKEKDIRGQVALVTGGGNGLGREISKRLADRGCNLAIVDLNIEAAAEVAGKLEREFGVKAKAYEADISDYNKVVWLARQIEEDLGVVTILVNNAGIMMFSCQENPEHQEVQNTINTNLTAHLWTIEVFLKKMKSAKKGHIVAISSLAGFIPLPKFKEYTATKYAVRGLMKALHLELKATGNDFIKTTTVYPTFMSTNQKVVALLKRIEYDEKIQIMPGPDAAKTIVDGVVRNKVEIFVPTIHGIAIKLIEFLPGPLQVFLSSAIFSTVQRV